MILKNAIALMSAFGLILGLCAFSDKQQVGPKQPQSVDPKAGLYKCEQGSWPVTSVKTIKLYNPDQKRDLALNIVYPSSGGGKFPVIIWSHGAFGSREAYDPLATFWASHGYIVIRPTHMDSTQNGTVPSLKNAFAFREWDVRPAEISLIISRLTQIEREAPGLSGHLKRDAIGMGGHSYGAHTAELLAGALAKNRFSISGQRQAFSDDRISAFMMVSPSGPDGVFNRDSFSRIKRPVLAVTGDNDAIGRTKQPPSWRREAWTLMPAGDKYFLWIANAYHGFGGISGGHRWKGAGPANSRQVDYVRCSGLAFWDAYLKGQMGGYDYLHGEDLKNATQGAAQLEFK